MCFVVFVVLQVLAGRSNLHLLSSLSTSEETAPLDRRNTPRRRWAEEEPFGVKVFVVEPGTMRTPLALSYGDTWKKGARRHAPAAPAALYGAAWADATVPRRCTPTSRTSQRTRRSPSKRCSSAWSSRTRRTPHDGRSHPDDLRRSPRRCSTRRATGRGARSGASPCLPRRSRRRRRRPSTSASE